MVLVGLPVSMSLARPRTMETVGTERETEIVVESPKRDIVFDLLCASVVVPTVSCIGCSSRVAVATEACDLHSRCSAGKSMGPTSTSPSTSVELR